MTEKFRQEREEQNHHRQQQQQHSEPNTKKNAEAVRSVRRPAQLSGVELAMAILYAAVWAEAVVRRVFLSRAIKFRP